MNTPSNNATIQKGTIACRLAILTCLSNMTIELPDDFQAQAQLDQFPLTSGEDQSNDAELGFGELRVLWSQPCNTASEAAGLVGDFLSAVRQGFANLAHDPFSWSRKDGSAAYAVQADAFEQCWLAGAPTTEPLQAMMVEMVPYLIAEMNANFESWETIAESMSDDLDMTMTATTSTLESVLTELATSE